MKNILVTGASGLVGRHLVPALEEQGYVVSTLTRSPGPPRSRVFHWKDLPGLLDATDAVINLAGENIGSRRWTARRRELLRASRVDTTALIVEAFRQSQRPPSLLLNASAAGFYGGRDATLLDESAASGIGFLAELCRQWETQAAEATTSGARVVSLRLGVVLARDGGAFPRMSLPVKCFVGTRLGHGQQGFSWIHIEDLVALILEILRNPRYAGPVNATAPCPVNNETFSRELASQLHRPLWPLPAFVTKAALRTVFGQMAEELLLQGVFVVPRKALDMGFSFRFPDLATALPDLLEASHPTRR